MPNDTKVLVTGAIGFMGHHLVPFRKRQVYSVQSFAIPAPPYCSTHADACELLAVQR